MTEVMTATFNCLANFPIEKLLLLIPMFPCHLYIRAMASVAIFMEILEWTWHYDLALDLLVLIPRSLLCI